MKRWLLYHTLTALDVMRLWPTVQHHVIIVAGICLPILLLLGLKNGHVAELRDDLLRSPTGRQVVFWSGQQGELMTVDTVRSFEQELPGVEIVIPEVQRLVSLSVRDNDGKSRQVESVTLYSTRVGDPILAQYGVHLAPEDGKGITLMSNVAEALKVGRGDSVTVTVERARDGMSESASVALDIVSVIDRTDAEENDVGYVDVETLAAMEQYVMGFQVREFGWPAFKVSAPDNYASYLAICENTAPLTPEDLRTLTERGFSIKKVETEELRTLYGLLKPESLDALLVYQLSAQNQDGAQTLNMAPGQLSRLTEADDIVIPWNEPLEVTANERPYRLVGLSIPQRTWLRLYLEHREIGFDFDADTFRIQFRDEPNNPALVKISSTNNSSIVLAGENLQSPKSAVPKSPVPEAPVPESPVPESAVPSGAAKTSEPPEQAESDVDDSSAAADSDKTAKSPVETSVEEQKPVVKEADTLPATAPDETADKETADKETADKETADKGTVEKGTVEKGTVEQGTAKQDDVQDPKPADADSSPPAPSNDTIEAETPRPVEETHIAVAVVPMDLLAHLRAEAAGRVEFDAINQLYVPLPRETLFDKARLYADTIDRVPMVVESLRERGFAIMSEVTRIREIHQQDHSLQLLVLIVGAGVFVFGTITVVSVLLDSTERKRGTIGILRVMGVSRVGVFYMVFLRAAIIGILAAGVTIGTGMLAAMFLDWQPPLNSEWAQWKPVIHVIIQPTDALIVVVGALTCCTLGAIVPANKASGMDPFEAIVEGRFR